MTRRHFLESLAAFAGGLTIARPALAKMPLRIELQRSPLAGFSYHHGEHVWSALAVGDTLDLVREAGNRHDGRAVRVDWNGMKLGYIPRTDNAAVSHLIDSGRAVTATISALRDGGNPWQRIELSVALIEPSPGPGIAMDTIAGGFIKGFAVTLGLALFSLLIPKFILIAIPLWLLWVLCQMLCFVSATRDIFSALDEIGEHSRKYPPHDQP